MKPNTQNRTCGAVDFTASLDQYTNTFNPSYCSGWSNPSALYFSITDNAAASVPNPSGIVVYVTGLTSSNVPLATPFPVSVTYLGQSGNVYMYKTSINWSTVSWTTNGTTFCDVSKIYMDMFMPFDCEGTDLAMEVEAFFDLSSITPCQTISPIYWDPYQSPSPVYFGGWVAPCSTPCHFIAPDQTEVEYRLQGTSTWTTVSVAYFGTISPFSLASGNYEYRFRNKETTPTACYGP